MVEALIYLAAAVICVPIAARLGLGSVIGYLLAGAAIGPWGLKLVGDVHETLQLAEFGVVLLLFVIGLELEPRRLIEMRKEVFGGGLLQVTLCGLALAAGLLAFGLSWQAAWVAGSALALSSTAIAVQTMTERNEIATPMGRTAFGILLFQDVAAIPLLAVVPLLGPMAEAADETGWSRFGIAFAAVAGVIVIGRYLTRPVLRLIARVDVREVFTAFTLLLVIGIAQLMTLAGLSMALGAFLAGVLLAGSEYRHALEADIEPFKGLLLGLFFIAVGMSVDFGLLGTRPGTVALLVGAFLAVKLAMLWVVARAMGVVPRQRALFAILISQGGEFGFVVFASARGAGILTREWEALLTVSVALSMAATPLLLLAYDKLQAMRECKEARKDDAIDMEAPVIIAGFGRFGQIVGRMLFANGIRAVVLDHDPEQIEVLRRFGFRIFYGDATRIDLLEAAGAKRARLLVNAIDDIEASLKLVDRVREHFPGLAIVARARNVTHYRELRERGVEVAERETFESALKVGRSALEALGVDRFRAREMAETFRRNNVATLEASLPHFHDEARLLTLVQAGREELELQFARDRERFEREHGAGWDSDESRGQSKLSKTPDTDPTSAA
jgi:glutathione-regulated potassium-efflux system ancillary protein KefC